MISNRYFETALQDDAAFFCFMAEHRLPGIGAGLISFVDDLQIAFGEVSTDLEEGNGATANFSHFALREKILLGLARI